MHIALLEIWRTPLAKIRVVKRVTSPNLSYLILNISGDGSGDMQWGRSTISNAVRTKLSLDAKLTL